MKDILKSSDDSAYRCPICRTQTLEERRDRNGLDVDVCSQCRGIWLDNDELSLLTKKEIESRELTEQLTWEASPTDLSCPRCNESLLCGTDVNGNVELDFCAKCQGIWFECGELRSTNELLILIQTNQMAESTTPNVVESAYAHPEGVWEILISQICGICSSRYRLVSNLLQDMPENEPKNIISEGVVRLSEKPSIGPLSKRSFGACFVRDTESYAEWIWQVGHDGGDWVRQEKKKLLSQESQFSDFEILVGDQAYEVNLERVPFELTPNTFNSGRISSNQGTSIIHTQELGYCQESDCLYAIISQEPYSPKAYSVVRFLSDRQPTKVLQDIRTRILRRIAIGAVLLSLAFGMIWWIINSINDL